MPKALDVFLSPRQICDLELLSTGAFAPLNSFVSQEDYESICENLTLKSGAVFPVPIALDISEELETQLQIGNILALRDQEGVHLADLSVREFWKPNRLQEAEAVFGTNSEEHPGVFSLMHHTKPVYASGELKTIQLPTHYDFVELRHTPEQLKQIFEGLGWKKVLGFQTRNPLHRAHFELIQEAAKKAEAKILLHPVVGLTKPGDIDHYTRVRAYRALMHYFKPGTAMLSLLNLAMRMGGPREAVLHALIRKNHGCTHFVVGRDHAGPGVDSKGRPFYEPYAAQELLQKYADRIGIEPVFSREMVYVPELKQYREETKVPSGQAPLRVSATQLRKFLDEGSEVPEWFSFPEVLKELKKTHRPKHEQGLTVFFTGLPSAGKSTLANVLISKLLEKYGLSATLLDGDLVRRHLSSELTFSREHRDLNILRIGYVASEITKHGGVAICAPIAPFAGPRKQVRELIRPHGGFFLVHVSTPLEECEKRDRKGLYQKARRGEIAQFTGVSDPYEVPDDADIVIDTISETALEAVERILSEISRAGYLERPLLVGAEPQEDNSSTTPRRKTQADG